MVQAVSSFYIRASPQTMKLSINQLIGFKGCLFLGSKIVAVFWHKKRELIAPFL